MEWPHGANKGKDLTSWITSYLAMTGTYKIRWTTSFVSMTETGRNNRDSGLLSSFAMTGTIRNDRYSGLLRASQWRELKKHYEISFPLSPHPHQHRNSRIHEYAHLVCDHFLALSRNTLGLHDRNARRSLSDSESLRWYLVRLTRRS